MTPPDKEKARSGDTPESGASDSPDAGPHSRDGGPRSPAASPHSPAARPHSSAAGPAPPVPPPVAPPQDDPAEASRGTPSASIRRGEVTADPTGTGAPDMVVAIGASAGGLAPLRDFLSALPPEPGASFVVLQHLSPDTPSMAPELLQPHVEMPLNVARDGAVLQPNEVVFLPEGASLEVEGGRLRLTRDKEHRTGTLIDTFLSALARDAGSRAVAVLLSGGGWDGTYGLKEIKEAGGMTMVQDPESSEFESMPTNAIRAGVVDVVQRPAELARSLVHYLERVRSTTGLGPDGVLPDPLATRLTTAIRSHTGHDFSEYKRGTFTRRVTRRAQLEGWGSIAEYVAEVEENEEEAHRLVGDLLIGVTGFFRDREAWDALEDRVLPGLFAGRGRGEAVRAWMVGCATGEEPYSLAMLLNERADERPDGPQPMIFATDIDAQALEFARVGLYPVAAVARIPSARRARFFTQEGEQLRMNDVLREQCIFAEHNVLRDPPFSRMDLVGCRNVMIYLEPAAQESLAEILAFALRPGGFLVLGSSENLENGRGLFETVDAKHRIFRRTEVPASLPAGMLSRRAGSRGTWTPSNLSVRRQPPEGPPRDARRGVQHILLHDFGPAALLVNARREVLEYFGRTGKYFEPSLAQGGRSVIDMALPSLRGPLRTALGAAEREGREISRRGLRLGEDGHPGHVDLTVRRLGEGDADVRFLVVLQERAVEDGSDPASPSAAGDSVTVREMEEELHYTQERLRATISQLETANEELQSTNEELLTMNEEFQTSKEEALSANEELNLVNQELRAKVAELDQAHADLENLFRSTQVATLFLDRERRIQRFTPTMTKLFALRDPDIGRPIGEITGRFDDAVMHEAIGEVLESLEPAQAEIHVPDDDSWYSLRVSPYRSLDDAVEGVVLTFADVTGIKRNEARLREEQLYAQSIIETVQQPLAVLDSKLRVASASRSFFDTFGYRPEEVLGSPLFDVGEGEWDVAELRTGLAAILPDGRSVEGVELEFELPSGGRRRMVVSARHLFARETERILVNLHDITDYWERVRVQQEEARRKDWFLAMLGHELRGPLAPIRNSISLLRHEGTGPEQAERFLDVIDRQVRHLTRLVSDLLDLSRIAEGKLSLERTDTDLVEVVRQTIEDYRSGVEEAGLRLEVALPEDPLRVHGDVNRLQQAIGNLIDNARKYTRGGGSVSVSVRPVRDSVAEVVVADTGVGMSPELLDEIFEPFRQGPPSPDCAAEGLGVGLTLVRTVSDAHGGSVRAESDGEACGSRFILTLPLSPGGSEPDSEPAAPGAASEGGREPRAAPLRIVLVEDHAFVAETTERILQLAGHEVITAADGAAALEAVERERPDVVICDLGLPGGMSGHDVARALRDHPEHASIHLIALTGFGQPKDRREAEAAGFDAFLVKPATQADLASALAWVGGE